MTNDEAKILLCRLQCIVDMMLRQKSGGDIHHTANIRHTAAMLMVAIDDRDIEFNAALALVGRLEAQTVEIFRKRYSSQQ